jgi:hypothetical protein
MLFQNNLTELLQLGRISNYRNSDLIVLITFLCKTRKIIILNVKTECASVAWNSVTLLTPINSTHTINICKPWPQYFLNMEQGTVTYCIAYCVLCFLSGVTLWCSKSCSFVLQTVGIRNIINFFFFFAPPATNLQFDVFLLLMQSVTTVTTQV